ncbi:TPR end-of-group domain-containing protein [Luteimonas kalidii]|uniref:Tetratricopeptide repeat protein n=1 Tax=Luteimonas kalidii TaxID=3042025 RepID=A0ABT6JPF9_9GAMM|nr:tetratricopeptide repeat protein [Luteimonas kalidii]MDH5832499.1 tetratricopeptide repeat protein [Luteimonas kalidii]
MSDWIGALRRGLAEFRRRRVFRVMAVYLVVAWLLVQVADATFEPLALPEWSARLLIVLLALGFAPTVVLAWIYDIGPQGVARTPLPPPGPTEPPAPADVLPQSATAAAGVAPAEASVAILPFADLSEDHDQDYFCDGLAEEILNALTRVRGLRVASRTSSFRFRDGATDTREIGRLLRVAAVMEGSVRKAGDQVRVTAQLIDAGNGYHLWSRTFDRRLEDIFAIQEEIARKVVELMRPSCGSAPELDLQRYAPRDMRAYEFYLRGRQLEGRTTAVSWRQAPQMFRRAIALDPGYAHAHAGLADALVELSLWRLEPADTVLEEARAAARRALELAPELAEAHVAFAHTLWLEDRHDAAAASFRRALELDPTLYVAHYYFARHCFARGEFARATDLFESAHAVDPGEFQALSLAVGAAEAEGDRDRTARLAREALEAALHQVEIDPDNARAHYMAAALLLRQGDVEGGRQCVVTALALRPADFDVLYNAACFHAMAGEADRALDLLERAVATGQGFGDWIERDPELASVRGLPRYRRILACLD